MEANPRFDHDNPLCSPKSLFYTWDFVQRTRHNLSQISVAALQAGDKAAQDEFYDVNSRCAMTTVMIGDKSGKMLRAMVPGEQPVDFGDSVREKAQALST